MLLYVRLKPVIKKIIIALNIDNNNDNNSIIIKNDDNINSNNNKDKNFVCINFFK